MIRRDGAEIRKERIKEMAKRVMAGLQKSGGKIPLKKTVSFLAFDFGLTKEKIMEYLRILENLDRFVLDVEEDRICRVIEKEENVE